MARNHRNYGVDPILFELTGDLSILGRPYFLGMRRFSFNSQSFNDWINDQLLECEVYDKYDCTPYIANALRFFYYLVENFKEEVNLESYIELSLRVNFEVLFEIPKDVTNYLVGEYAELNITPSLSQRSRSHQETANDSGTESAIWHIDSILNELNAEGGKNGKN